jgi:hypothetical protein
MSSRATRRLPRSRGAIALAAASVALLATMPTASALAGADPDGPSATATGVAHAVRPLTAPGELLSAAQLETLLAGLPLSDLDATQLAHYLAGLEGVSALATLHVGLLGTETLGFAGLEADLREGIEALGDSATIGALANPAALLPNVEAKLDTILTTLLGTGPQQALSAALAKLDLDQLVGSLLETAHEPSQLSALSDLANKLFTALGAGAVEGLTGSTLPGPFAATTVENVAKELSSSPEAVSSELGQTAAQLPATATMLTAPLASGKLLAVAPAVKGLAVGLLGSLTGEKGGAGESPGESGSGGGSGKGGSGSGQGGASEGSGAQGGSGTGTSGSGSAQNGAGTPGGAGGPGSGGSAGTLTVLVTLPSTANAGSSTTHPAAKAAPRKIAIRSARTRGAVATIVIQTPAAGRLTLRGHGLATTVHRVPRAARLRLTLTLSKAARASLRRHRLRIALHASFQSTAGARSSATTTVSFA